MSLNSENCADGCKRCSSRQRINVENALDYHEQIERLQAELKERKNVMTQMDRQYAENLTRYEADVAKSQEEYAKLKYRHEALLDAFKMQQRVNHTLEDKFLSVVSEMTKRYEAVEAKCKTLATNLEAANAKIGELTAENLDDEDMANKSAPVTVGFSSGLYPMYHSSPDLCGMVQRQRQRNSCPAKKQTYSPFAIQTFPPTLICDTSSFTDSLTAKRVHDSDGGNYDEVGNTAEDVARSRSNSGTNAYGPSSSHVPPTSTPNVVMSTVVNERANDTSFELTTHRPNNNIGSVFTI